jgi:hypothetical protein
MIGLHPSKRLIADCIDEKHAGKSWPVNMRHEVHGKDSGQGLHFSQKNIFLTATA